MALVVVATCENCGASQLDDGRILVAPERALDCQTHTFIQAEVVKQPRSTGVALGSMPSQKECIANDQLTDHLYKVEENINRTNLTIQTLEERHDHWRKVINEDFQRVLDAADARREYLLNALDDLVHHKQDLLGGQLQEYIEHRDNCQGTLDSIFERIQYEKRDFSRQESIVEDSRTTIAAFPRLIPIPIAIAAECQTQPIVSTLDSFGAILESSLGRLPTVMIDEVDERQTVKYRVIDPEDSEEKVTVTAIQGLEVEVQASVFGGRSLGWDIAWTTRIPCQSVSGTIRLDVRSLPAAEKVFVRARTIIIDGKEPTDPVRVSRWSDVTEAALKSVRPSRPPPRANSGVAPFFVCMDASSTAKFPCKPKSNQSDYVAAIKNLAIEKFKWKCSPEDVTLKIVEKGSDNVVVDLAAEEAPNDVLLDVWDRQAHMIKIFQQGVHPSVAGVGSAPPQPEPEPEPEPIEWPRRLMLRIKADASPQSAARPNPLKIEDRDGPGGWLGVMQAKYRERFNAEGELRFFFVDADGNRVKDIVKDSDFLYSQEVKTKLFVVGEQV